MNNTAAIATDRALRTAILARDHEATCAAALAYIENDPRNQPAYEVLAAAQALRGGRGDAADAEGRLHVMLRATARSLARRA